MLLLKLTCTTTALSTALSLQPHYYSSHSNRQLNFETDLQYGQWNPTQTPNLPHHFINTSLSWLDTSLSWLGEAWIERLTTRPLPSAHRCQQPSTNTLCSDLRGTVCLPHLFTLCQKNQVVALDYLSHDRTLPLNRNDWFQIQTLNLLCSPCSSL